MTRSAICLAAALLGCSWISLAHAGGDRAAARPIPAGLALQVQQRLQAKYGPQMARQAKVLHRARPAAGESLADVIRKAQSLAAGPGAGKQGDLKAMWQLLDAARAGKLGPSAPAGPGDLEKLAAKFAATTGASPADALGGAAPLLDLPVPEDVPPAGGTDQLMRTLQQTNPAVMQKALEILRNPQAADPAVRTALQAVLQQRGPDGKPTQAATGLKRLMSDPKQVDKLEQMVGVLQGLKPPAEAGDLPAARPGRNPHAASRRPGSAAVAAPRGQTPTPQPPRLKLSGILSRPGGNVALLNGQPVRPGQTVAGYRVLQIEARRVTLTKDGQRITVRLAR